MRQVSRRAARRRLRSPCVGPAGRSFPPGRSPRPDGSSQEGAGGQQAWRAGRGESQGTGVARLAPAPSARHPRVLVSQVERPPQGAASDLGTRQKAFPPDLCDVDGRPPVSALGLRPAS